jgi:hypothetical protein
MNSSEVDNKLYKLSRWEAFKDYISWTVFVKVCFYILTSCTLVAAVYILYVLANIQHSPRLHDAPSCPRHNQHGYEPLHVQHDVPFTFLEIGVGVGAWIRTFLREFPLAHDGFGIDYEKSAIDVAQIVLPKSQITVHQLDMFDVPDKFQDKQFDYVFIPGTLCYAESYKKMIDLVEGLITHRVIRSGGKMSVTMISYSKSLPSSCITEVEKEYWYTSPGWKVIEIQEMNDWRVPHSQSRYAVYLQADY